MSDGDKIRSAVETIQGIVEDRVMVEAISTKDMKDIRIAIRVLLWLAKEWEGKE